LSTDFNVIDKFVKVNDEDSAYSARELIRKEGMFVGYTSGAALQAIKQLSVDGEFSHDSVVVVIFPDHGSRYTSKIYNDKWMLDQGFTISNNINKLKKVEYIE
jgi:cystathionine beta-synthase